MAKTKIGIGYSSLSERVYIGKQKDLGGGTGVFTGDKEDITNQFLGICAQYFEEGTSRIISCGDHTTMYIAIANTREAKERLIKSLQKELAHPIREPL